jgi:hypothetical protein
MASDEFVDNTIANLKIIGMVGQNGKLRVRKGQLCLEKDDRMQPVRRWASGDSRDLTLLHIRNAISNATRITAMLAGGGLADATDNFDASVNGVNGSNGSNSSNNVNNSSRRWTVARITAELSQCETGLQNLRTTYTADSIMVANIGVIIERLAAHREAMAGMGFQGVCCHHHRADTEEREEKQDVAAVDER